MGKPCQIIVFWKFPELYEELRDAFAGDSRVKVTLMSPPRKPRPKIRIGR